jgi:putative MATE family efflux protein
VALVRLALSSQEQDFTRTPLGRAVLLLAIPMVLEPLMEALFAVADVFFVAKLGADAVAVLGLTEGLITLVYTLGFGLAIPATALVARRIGEGRRQDAASVAVQANLVGLLTAIPLAAAGVLLAGPALSLMGATRDVVELGTAYAAITLGSAPVIVLLFVNAAIFRGAGNAVVPLRALWLANGINLVLDPCLIFGLGPFPELGVLGAGIASLIGRSAGVAYMWWLLLRGTARVRISREHLRFDADVSGQLWRLSWGSLGQLLIETSSWVLLTRIVALSGSVAVAGYTIAIRILLFFLMPAWGLSSAAATLVGQNLGAKQPERAERAIWLTGGVNFAFLGGVTVLCLVAADPISRAFSGDGVVQQLAAQGVRTVAYGYVFYAWGMVFVQSFNGAGDTRTPFWLNLFCFWLFKLPLAYFLSVHVTATRGTFGVFLAVCLAYSLNAALAFVWFRSGRWKTRFAA